MQSIDINALLLVIIPQSVVLIGIIISGIVTIKQAQITNDKAIARIETKLETIEKKVDKMTSVDTDIELMKMKITDVSNTVAKITEDMNNISDDIINLNAAVNVPLAVAAKVSKKKKK